MQPERHATFAMPATDRELRAIDALRVADDAFFAAKAAKKSAEESVIEDEFQKYERAIRAYEVSKKGKVPKLRPFAVKASKNGQVTKSCATIYNYYLRKLQFKAAIISPAVANARSARILQLQAEIARVQTKHTLAYQQKLTKLFVSILHPGLTHKQIIAASDTIKRELPCIMCDTFCVSAASMDYDHVNPATKRFIISNLFHRLLHAKPSKDCCVFPDDTCDTNFHALMIEVRKLVLICMVCHARKSFAALELAALRQM